jgi:hypothetical protein
VKVTVKQQVNKELTEKHIPENQAYNFQFTVNNRRKIDFIAKICIHFFIFGIIFANNYRYPHVYHNSKVMHGKMFSSKVNDF